MDLPIYDRNLYRLHLSPADIESFGAKFGGMASAWGNNLWQLAALVICMFILMYGVGSGIEKANKVMMPIFFILFVILGIYVAFQRELLPDTAISSAWSRKFWQSFHLDLRTWTGIFLPVCCR